MFSLYSSILLWNIARSNCMFELFSGLKIWQIKQSREMDVFVLKIHTSHGFCLIIFAGLPADLKSQGNLIFFQGQGIVREF